jgi:hypothetical protein
MSVVTTSRPTSTTSGIHGTGAKDRIVGGLVDETSRNADDLGGCCRSVAGSSPDPLVREVR